MRPSLGAALRLLLQPSTLRQWPRVFREGRSPVVLLLIQANNIALVNRLLHKGKRVIFLSSFPRSGNTWMRYLLTDVLLQGHGVETTTELPVHPENLIPELRCDCLLSRFARCPHWAQEPPTAFIKTHFLFPRLAQILSLRGGRNSGPQPAAGVLDRDCRVLYFYRAPEDALVSLYHLKRHDDYARCRATHALDAFCLKVVSAWKANLGSYLRAADEGFPVFFVSYESMLQETATALGGALRWLGVPHEDQTVRRAVSNMEFSNLQASERKAKQDGDPVGDHQPFFRRGGVGAGCAELKDSTLREIRDRTAALLKEANDRQAGQTADRPTPVLGVPNPPTSRGAHRNGEARDLKASPRAQPA
jgi:hypothetical protein